MVKKAKRKRPRVKERPIAPVLNKLKDVRPVVVEARELVWEDLCPQPNSRKNAKPRSKRSRPNSAHSAPTPLGRASRQERHLSLPNDSSHLRTSTG